MEKSISPGTNLQRGNEYSILWPPISKWIKPLVHWMLALCLYILLQPNTCFMFLSKTICLTSYAGFCQPNFGILFRFVIDVRGNVGITSDLDRMGLVAIIYIICPRVLRNHGYKWRYYFDQSTVCFL